MVPPFQVFQMKIVVSNSFCSTYDVDERSFAALSDLLTYKDQGVVAEKIQVFQSLARARQGKKTGLIASCLVKLSILAPLEFVCVYKNNSFPTGLLSLVKDYLKICDIPFEIEDLRKPTLPTTDYQWNCPHLPRPYQIAMHEAGLKHHRGVFEAAVGSGKTMIMGRLVYALKQIALIIEPSKALCDQTYNEFAKWFGADNVEIVTSSRVKEGTPLKPIRICTIQGLAALQKNDVELLNVIVGDVGALFVDEVHHAGAASYSNLQAYIDHIYFRYGFSGKFVRNDSKSLEMWGFLSHILYRYPPKQAIAEGYLTPIKVHIHTVHGKRSNSYKKEYDNCYLGNPALLAKIKDIMIEYEGQQILTLVKNKAKAGEVLHKYLAECFLPCEYISGDNKTEVIIQAIKDFNDKVVTRLIGSKVIGEGIDIRSADHEIMAQGGKADGAVVQAVGRLVRLSEGKLLGIVHDFKFTGTKYMRKHLTDRIKIYEDNFGAEIIFIE